MDILIDTNVILDALQKRTPFCEYADKILNYCVSGKIKGYIAIHSVSNLFFILRKQFSVNERKTLLLSLLSFINVAGIEHEAVEQALLRDDFSDFEDCLQDECAKNVCADYIITRNINDFLTSTIPAITPEDFIYMQKY